jgi:hypothetical protein
MTSYLSNRYAYGRDETDDVSLYKTYTTVDAKQLMMSSTYLISRICILRINENTSFLRKAGSNMSNSYIPDDLSPQRQNPSNNTSTPPGTPIPTSVQPENKSGSNARLMSLLHPGELLAALGGIVTLEGFYSLPFLSSATFSVSGKELASRSWQLTTQGWQLPATASGLRWLLWLMVVSVVIAIILSVLRFLGLTSRSERTTRWLCLLGGAPIVLLFIGFFTQYSSALVSGFSLDVGFWLTLIGTALLAAGAYLEFRRFYTRN